ncbi:MAG: hypothetical protein SVV80_03605 [Planctomycetota bacterium]|nr:hypothetical protein [Planctomycetota bacterium]
MSENKATIEHECANCGNRPAANVQKLWVKWKYDAEEDEYSSEFEVLDVPVLNTENLHLCNDCMTLWGEGII